MGLDESFIRMVGSGTVVRQAATPSAHAIHSVASACLPILLFTSSIIHIYSFLSIGCFSEMRHSINNGCLPY